MTIFSPKPYKLFNKIQYYDWGTKNEEAFIPKFIGIVAETNKPYAELWIGAHPKAPSEIEVDGKRISLDKFIESNTVKCLGNYAAQKFDGKFPFLLKVLSAAEALSIQTHPNKEQAKLLHAKDPVNYPDANHKPEIAIAIDSLSAIAGFRRIEEIIINLKSLPELKEFIGSELIDKIFMAQNTEGKKNNIQELYSSIMKNAHNKKNLDDCVKKIFLRLKSKNNLSLEENQFIQQYSRYGSDIGLFSFFFFNLIELKSKQAIFTGAGIPHAYLKGNIIECMANSDNVVRAGLTEKFKDVETLLGILKYDFEKYNIINPEQLEDEVIYKTAAEEFQVALFSKDENYTCTCCSREKPSIYLITEGGLTFKWISEGVENSTSFKSGDSIFLPASLNEYEIYTNGTSRFYKVEIP